MQYPFTCDRCGYDLLVICPVAERERARYCPTCMTQLRRVFTAPIINADLEKDRPENQLGRILTRSTSRKDWHEALLKASSKHNEACETAPGDDYKYTSVDDILSTGLHPKMTKEAVMNWREANIPKDDFDAAP